MLLLGLSLNKDSNRVRTPSSVANCQKNKQFLWQFAKSQKETPACFALCPFALPHDVTGGDVSDVIRRQRTRNRQKRPSGKGQGRLGQGRLVLTRAAATQQRRAVVSKQHTTTECSRHNGRVTSRTQHNTTQQQNEVVWSSKLENVEHEERVEI